MNPQAKPYSKRISDQVEESFERSERFFQVDGYWFFKTRENIDYGPYESVVECRYAYNDFLDVVDNQSLFEGFAATSESIAYSDEEGVKIPKITLL
ncbi:MAG: DUF6316 family protein [Gammaproteobacteria bacterium]|nr:DUF6316 family protein [Gammaproteobacteria bacterium]MDH5628888.1 DUF6316 family protein [Gammaproteobacteria bacterium]